MARTTIAHAIDGTGSVPFDTTEPLSKGEHESIVRQHKRESLARERGEEIEQEESADDEE